MHKILSYNLTNWCSNHITINGPKDKVEAIWSKANDNTEEGLLGAMVPIGEWEYHTALKTWGTKWDVSMSDSNLDFFKDKDSAVIEGFFESAWSPPLGAVQEYLDNKFSKVYSIENLPIDVIISPEVEIAKSIQRKLEAPGALDNVPFADNKIRLLEIDVDESCPLIGIKLEDITKKFSKLEANILGVIRNEKFIYFTNKT